MKLQKLLTVAFVAVLTLGLFGQDKANAAGTYSISCKNDAYGMQLGADYTSVAYIYMGLHVTSIASKDGRGQYLNDPTTTGAYVGNDCIYAGAGDTNGTQVVAADVARLAVNAIVGAVTNRIDAAYAARDTGTSATGLTFSTHGDGVAMSANGMIGGLSLWADMGNSNFENTQAFSNVRVDSMRFDGSSSSYSVGVDKTFGKALIGIVVSNLDSDITTSFNDGTYKQEIDTYGVYLGYRTSVLQIDLGMGQGDSTIDTTRRDLGNDQTITGSTTADIEYSNARIAASFTRGKFSIMPSISYRQMSMDIKAFTDDRPDDVSGTVVGGAATIFSTNNATLTVTDDRIAARSISTESMDVGLKVAANLGRVVPYLDLSYTSEDTTKATYKTEAGTDGNDTELAGTNYSSSMHIGAGMNFNLGSHITGGVRVGNINGRDDWEEDYISGNLSLGF